MKSTNSPYRLIQTKTGDPLFYAAFVKYYPDTPFCALLEEYPVERTNIWVCRKVDPREREFGYRLASLISHGTGTEKTIGHYVKVFEASSEKEAEDRLIANLIGTSTIRAEILKE